MDLFTNDLKTQRLSQAAKNKNSKQWYKDQCDLLDSKSFSNSTFMGYGGVSEYRRKKVNYDLFNNNINLRDFEYVCKPYGSQMGELPASMVNRDIVSGKIKILIGMESEMPFSYRVVAVNEEATTRKEQEEFGRIKDFVVNSIMQPIKEQLEMQAKQQSQEGPLNDTQKQQIAQQVQQQLESQTPDEVRQYMLREHQDPAEALATQLLSYLVRKQNIKDKFNKGWKHGLIAGEEVYWVGILNGEPVLRVVNPLFFDYDKSPDIDYIEDGEWAVCEYRMTPTEIVSAFGSELSNPDIDKIYEYGYNPVSNISDFDFSFKESSVRDPYTIRVIHTTWKSLRKIGFLTYLDEEGQPQLDLVDENYKINKEQGDIGIEWEWIPEAHEAWKIGSDIYCYMRPVPGQFKDLDNLYECKLSYYGGAYDNLNSEITSVMDRIKSWQYFHDILMYKLELLINSDKGRKFALNIGAIAKSAGLDLQKTLYYMDALNIIPLNPHEEGNKAGGDVTNMIKEIDMSLASDIQKYIQLLEYVNTQCGESVGVNKNMEGATGPSEAVTNTKQNLIQSSYMLRPYFDYHSAIKANALTALLQTAKVAYSDGHQRKLPYILDDMSLQILTVDQNLLDNSTYGLFISDSSRDYDAKEAIKSLAQAALQNQMASLSDVIKVLRSESSQEAEELLDVAEEKKQAQMQAQQAAQGEQAKELEQMKQANLEKQWEHDKEMVVLKEEERRKTVIQQQTILSLGFNENKDMDNDGTPDVLEVAKFGVDANIKNRKLDLEEDKLAQKTKNDAAKIAIEKKKIAQNKTISK